MNRRHALLLLAGLPLATRAQTLKNLAGSLKDPLISLLSSQLGVTDNQAKGGVGSFLTLAKEKLPAADFSKITNLLPNAGKYMELAKTLGAVAGPLKNAAGLNGSLGKLGMNSDTVAKFVPTVTDFLGKAGGSTVTNLLATVLK
ncbi:MAG: DUF2780 domain-containing protein [Steroidobacteraceae bacterium]